MARSWSRQAAWRSYRTRASTLQEERSASSASAERALRQPFDAVGVEGQAVGGADDDADHGRGRALGVAGDARQRGAVEAFRHDVLPARADGDEQPVVREPERVRVPDHRHYETPLGADGHADVVEVLHDDVAANPSAATRD